MRSIPFAVSVVTLLTVGNAYGDNIFVGSPTCQAPPGCAVFGNEVNGISGTAVTLAGVPTNAALANPVLLMIGVLNPTGPFTAPSVTLSPTGTGSLGGTPPSGLTWNTSTGFAGTMTSGGDAYSTIGLTDPFAGSGNSESFGNWSAAESAVLGLTANSFGIYVYELSNTGLDGSKVNVTFGSQLPVGTFVVAYGCGTTNWTSSCGSGKAGTPFTQSALAVPESPFLPILGCDLLGFAGLAWIFRRRLGWR